MTGSEFRSHLEQHAHALIKSHTVHAIGATQPMLIGSHSFGPTIGSVRFRERNATPGDTFGVANNLSQHTAILRIRVWQREKKGRFALWLAGAREG